MHEFGHSHQKGCIGKGRVSLFGVPKRLGVIRDTFSGFSRRRGKRFEVLADDRRDGRRDGRPDGRPGIISGGAAPPNLPSRDPQTRSKLTREGYKTPRDLT